MKFIEILLENSKVKEAKLYAPAKKASNNPETGITIQNKSAYHVIKDCANITIKYLPHYVFANYEYPFTELSGKFKRKDIEEFVSSTEKDIVLNQKSICVEPRKENFSNNIFDSLLFKLKELSSYYW
jgi:hypothetical protein